MSTFEDDAPVVIPAQAGIHHVLQGVTNVACGIPQDVLGSRLRGNDAEFWVIKAIGEAIEGITHLSP